MHVICKGYFVNVTENHLSPQDCLTLPYSLSSLLCHPTNQADTWSQGTIPLVLPKGAPSMTLRKLSNEEPPTFSKVILREKGDEDVAQW
jgi:hypothetical protein